MAINTLQLVNLVSSDGMYAPGLVSTRGTIDTSLRIDEQAAVFNAKTFEYIDYIFFRRFSDGRSSQIAAYVINNSDERLNEEALARLHQKVWLHGAAPLIYIFWPTKIDILTCARGPDFWEKEECQYSPVEQFEVETLETASEITDELNKLKRFSALRLADGTFWEEPINKTLADYNRTAHQSLIQAVVETDKDLEGESNPILRQLLLLMVLIKYLEDRHVFPLGFFGEFHEGAKDFLGVLKGGVPQEVYRLLDSLENKFDGDIFSIPGQDREILTGENLVNFANLVEAKTIKKQRCLWEQFSFEHLPVEIISNLYQRFVDGGHGTVYTPPFLASLLLDYAMPYEKLTGEERVLDPACGSGIFLVGAFKRLVNVWRSHNGWQSLDVDTLKQILKKSIFGIELDRSAIQLTAFSMCLAICDALQPNVIWEKLKFDKLYGNNLLEADSFSVILDFYNNKPTIFQDGFDVVIGNPPFESSISEAGKEVDKIAQRLDSNRGSLPDNQSAYLFLEQAFNILRAAGQVCLIQPGGLLYNRKTQDFRTCFFRKRKVGTIFDFVSIRNLFEGADSKTIAVLGEASEPHEDQRIAHLTFRRTLSVKEHICFEIDHYDWHHISQKQIETCPYVWRSDLLGGGRLLDISQRLQSMRKLVEYVKHKGWDYGEGFITGEKIVDENNKILRTPAPFLTGGRLLPNEALTDTGINEAKITNVDDTLFHTAYTEDRYSPPLVLFRKIDSLPIAFWDKYFIAYPHTIVGIHAPHDETSELIKFYNTISDNHDIYRFSNILNSASLIGKSTAILKKDIDELPYPEDLSEFSFSFWERALCDDITKYMTEYIRLGQNSNLLMKAATINDLQIYSDTFIRMLRSVYDNLQVSTPVFLD